MTLHQFNELDEYVEKKGAVMSIQDKECWKCPYIAKDAPCRNGKSCNVMTSRRMADLMMDKRRLTNDNTR